MRGLFLLCILLRNVLLLPLALADLFNCFHTSPEQILVCFRVSQRKGLTAKVKECPRDSVHKIISYLLSETDGKHLFWHNRQLQNNLIILLKGTTYTLLTLLQYEQP